MDLAGRSRQQYDGNEEREEKENLLSAWLCGLMFGSAQAPMGVRPRKARKGQAPCDAATVERAESLDTFTEPARLIKLHV